MLNGNPEPLTPLTNSPFTAGSNPTTPVIEPTGHYLYVYNSGEQSVEAYSINQSSGELTEINTYSIDNPDVTGLTEEGGLAIDPSGNIFMSPTRWAWATSRCSPSAPPTAR